MKKFIAFFEIPASDFHRAVDFYETVLGMQLPTFECETEKMTELIQQARVYINSINGKSENGGKTNEK